MSRLRADLAVAADLVPPGSSVLDLGCGDGALLAHLRDARGCDVQGVELTAEGVSATVARGIPVVQADLDEGLRDLADGSFDVVVLSQTLQVVRDPRLVFRELTRVGRLGIVSFPNFGHWRSRVRLAVRGRMPVSPALPYAWYDTPNIHLTTVADFTALCRAEGASLSALVVPGADGRRDRGPRSLWPNLLADQVVAAVTSGAVPRAVS
ncbi:MAG: methionine biosynthesis protein MetW [Anaerosomatales bacterium]|nr:methionine biosynthesis protein MetW [Anaerosomatales bacterium]